VPAELQAVTSAVQICPCKPYAAGETVELVLDAGESINGTFSVPFLAAYPTECRWKGTIASATWKYYDSTDCSGDPYDEVAADIYILILQGSTWWQFYIGVTNAPPPGAFYHLFDHSKSPLPDGTGPCEFGYAASNSYTSCFAWGRYGTMTVTVP
jgi:hypothetical protein